jgi:aspartate/methionine/tyrosine aminotransferase
MMPPIYTSEGTYTLSEYERLALTNRINLSDGHARLDLSPQQRSIVGRSLELFDRAVAAKQGELEAAFLDRFFECARQNPQGSSFRKFLTFSSSSAIKIAAQYCRLRQLTVHLIEPCFDNILYMLRTEGVCVIPLLEHELYDLDTLASRLNPGSALWVIQPNNPTGFCLDQSLFTALTELVAERGATLVVDFCFRLYSDQLTSWDQYEVLRATGANVICFEDTGKTWPLADTKIGITVCSADPAPIIYRLHDELLLNVSPLHLVLLTEFIAETLTHGLETTLLGPIGTNRRLVHGLVEEGVIAHATEWCHNVPMELLQLPENANAQVFWTELSRRGVDVLPASNYFWSRPDYGRSLFRLPLSRPLRELECAMPIFKQTLLDRRNW